MQKNETQNTNASPEKDKLTPADKIREFYLIVFCFMILAGVYIKIVFF